MNKRIRKKYALYASHCLGALPSGRDWRDVFTRTYSDKIPGNHPEYQRKLAQMDRFLKFGLQHGAYRGQARKWVKMRVAGDAEALAEFPPEPWTHRYYSGWSPK